MSIRGAAVIAKVTASWPIGHR